VDEDIKKYIIEKAEEYLCDTGRSAEVVYLPVEDFVMLTEELGGTPDTFEGMQVHRCKGRNIQFGQKGGE